MKTFTLLLAGVLIALYAAAILVPFDPEERRPGTRLSGQEVGPGDGGLSDIRGRNKVYVETATWYLIPHSVTTTSWTDNGVFYVPCGACDGKRWPRNVARNPEVRVKVGEKIYPRTAIRLNDEERRRVLDVAADEALPDVAVFRMDPR